MKYKGIIFDFDGTLVNTIEDLTDSLNCALKVLQQKQVTLDEGKRLIGKGLRNFIKDALPKALREDAVYVDQATDLLKSEYQKRYIAKTKPYPGIEALLATLKKEGIPFGINTNKPTDAAKYITENLFNIEDFVGIYGFSNAYPRKPDPSCALRLAEEMTIKPSECLYIGDSLVDYQTARNAKMDVLMCEWGFGDEKDLSNLKETQCIKTPQEILERLK